MWQFARPLAGLMNADPGVQKDIVNYLFWNFLALPCTVTTMILAGAFRGAGATLYNLIIFGLASWGLRVPLAWIFGHLVFGQAKGIWMAMFCSMAIQAGLMLLVYSTRNWQRFSMYARKINNQGMRHGPAVRTP